MKTKTLARFEVSTEGMRALQSGREPWQLAKELISNAWDESITRCNVTLVSTGDRKAELVVEDNGTGFNDITDAWTLMGHTRKRGNPSVRGRFNIGEKEILSIAKTAMILSGTHVVSFPEEGGRIISKANQKFIGTKIICELTWGVRQVETTIEKLKNLLVPKGIEYTVNGTRVFYQEPKQTIQATLQTVLQDNINEPLRLTRRKTDIELIPNENGVLLEMGIPIQEIDCPFLVNVMQKVPMPPNRDVVNNSYLQDIYAIVLNNTFEELPKERAAETWVRQAVEDDKIEPEAVKQVMTKRFGDNVVLWSSDQAANERAIEHGYEVVHGRTLSEGEREKMKDFGGLEHSSDAFPVSFGESVTIPQDDWTEGMIRIAKYVARLSKELLGFTVGVNYYRMQNGKASATWDGHSINFDVTNLGKSWFNEIGSIQTGLILHELAHHKGNHHNYDYNKNHDALAGMAVHLALTKPKLWDI